MPANSPPRIALAREAMATRFEIVLYGDDLVSLRAAGEEALNEIERLDKQLNLYNPASEIACINARAAREPVRVEPGLLQLLEDAQRLHEETGGAFDITVAPLLRCWGFLGGRGKVPTSAELAEARAKSGMHLVRLDHENRTVQFLRDGVMLDLGAIGKGYAVQQAINLLQEAGVGSAILHGGTSTVYGLGQPPEAATWKVAVEYPAENPDIPPALLALVPLKDEALSVSAVSGKAFHASGRTYGHVIDPQTGQPASSAALAAVVLSSATETDAFSTALLTLGVKGHNQIASLRPGMRTLVIGKMARRPGWRIAASGVEVNTKELSGNITLM